MGSLELPFRCFWSGSEQARAGQAKPGGAAQTGFGLQQQSKNQQDMALIGTVDPYVPNTSFSNYVEHFEYFFSVNAITDDKKKDLFMNLCGMAVFNELKLLYPATDLKTLSYAEITKKLKERFDRVESEVVLRYKFRCRMQSPSESGENYILAVKLLAEQCDFGEFRDSAIRDQLIYGVYDKDLQRQLLNEDNLLLKTAEKLIKNRDLVSSRAMAINAENVNSVRFRLGRRDARYERRYDVYRRNDRSRSRNRDRYTWNDRGRSDLDRRSPGKGRYANFTCFFCKQKGHVQKNCYRFKNSQRGAVNAVKDDADRESDSENVHDYFKRLRVEYDTENESTDLVGESPDLGPQGAD